MTTTENNPIKVNSILEFTRLLENEPISMLGEPQELRDAIISIAPKDPEKAVRCFWKGNLYVCSR